MTPPPPDNSIFPNDTAGGRDVCLIVILMLKSITIGNAFEEQELGVTN